MGSLKLNQAIKEIKQILDKHNIAGAVVLHTPGTAEYLYKINPSYSLARVEGKDFFYKLDADKHYGGSTVKRNRAAEDTANMFKLMADMLQGMAFNTLTASKFIDQHLGITHKETAE